MANKLHLEVISPDEVFWDDEVDTAVVRTIEGDVGLMNEHLPMVSPLIVGRIKIVKDGKAREASCAEGVVKIRGNRALVITGAVEWVDEIDIERARKAKERAEQRLEAKKNDVDLDRANIAMTKALNRIKHYERLEK
ncbi:ATP synthase F1 subunit epsilon [Tindallia californiensis]|uniref:ATP synthase epsilon chain n=1 Tax=Tindallia californiensis TaxID=159292 RepID=A0A1H3LFM6_9FIRM|nr:ATP synthase F1 subunit epsilon [Tindallia californiensis]SDY63232.1 ATP synthase F1 subcomplex epsilon subunit [Tindallia californiensis]